MISNEAKVALVSFGGVCFPMLLLIYIITNFHIHSLINYIVVPIIVIIFAAVKSLYKGLDLQIAIRASLLGFLCCLGIYIRLYAPSHIKIFGAYMCVMTAFHYSEFLIIALIDPKQVSISSFMLNHSPQYIIAAVSSWVEFFLETYFFPGMKQWHFLSNVGLLMCVGGEILRKTAMLTAGSNFNHMVQCEKANDHILVTHGVYNWFRHPSYVGWFYWSIGTQIILLNPICIIGYILASWSFFKERIYIEEITLLNFFGQQYCDYQDKVATGLPFIEGYRI